jgi:hypothetical protein
MKKISSIVSECIFLITIFLVVSCSENNENTHISISQKSDGNFSESQKTEITDTESICFYMYYPSGGKRVVIEEYITLWVEGDKLRGFGAGRSEGEDNWSFSFEGSFGNQTKATISSVYKQVGNEPFALNEVWKIDLKKQSLELDSNLPTDLRIFGDGKFHSINCSNIGDWAIELIKKSPEK